MQFVLTTVVRAQIDSVYDVVCRPELYQYVIPAHYPSVRVLSVRGDTSVAEEHLNMGGSEMVMMVRHVSCPPHRHETLVIGGDAKGMHIVHELEEKKQGPAPSDAAQSATADDGDTCDFGQSDSVDNHNRIYSNAACGAAPCPTAASPGTVTVITTTVTQRSGRLSVLLRMQKKRPDRASFRRIVDDLAGAVTAR